MSMTVARKKRLTAVLEKIETLRAEVEEILDEEQCRYDEMSEARQGGNVGETLGSHLESASEAIDRLNEATEALANIE
jgi:hypothetical protein